MKKFDIPKEVSAVVETLNKANFEAYLVGGCVRDLVMGKEPKDCDVTTNAKPEQIINLFEKTVYENKFGTVGVYVNRETQDKVSQETSKDVIPAEAKALASADETSSHDVIRETPEYIIVEVTPYRIDAKYSDFS